MIFGNILNTEGASIAFYSWKRNKFRDWIRSQTYYEAEEFNIV